MKPAYRIPDNDCACIAPGTAPAATRPIGRFNVRSFITSIKNGDQVRAGAAARRARHRLRRRPGHPRSRRGRQTAARPGAPRRSAPTWAAIRSASSRSASRCRRAPTICWCAPGTAPERSQPMEALWSPSGYMRNVVESSGRRSLKGSRYGEQTLRRAFAAAALGCRAGHVAPCQRPSRCRRTQPSFARARCLAMRRRRRIAWSATPPSTCSISRRTPRAPIGTPWRNA